LSERYISVPLTLVESLSRDATPKSIEGCDARRWWTHVVLLLAYWFLCDPIRFLLFGPDIWYRGQPGLSLLLAEAKMWLIFAFFLLAAIRVSGASSRDLLLRWSGGIRLIGYAVGWAIAITILELLATLALEGLVQLVSGVSAEQAMDIVHGTPEEQHQAPEGESGPTYRWFYATVTSFITAGLMEELWRIGLLAAAFALFPRSRESWSGNLIACAVIGCLFGLGHRHMGWGPVVTSGLAGLAFGIIILKHGTIWVAVLAHGFMDAFFSTKL
jgi:hypothetical protein